MGLPNNGWAEREMEPELLNGDTNRALVLDLEDLSPFLSGEKTVLEGEERTHNMRNTVNSGEEGIGIKTNQQATNASTMEASQGVL